MSRAPRRRAKAIRSAARPAKFSWFFIHLHFFCLCSTIPWPGSGILKHLGNSSPSFSLVHRCWFGMGIASRIRLRVSNSGPGTVLRQVSNLPQSGRFYSSTTSSLLPNTHAPGSVNRRCPGRRLPPFPKNYSTTSAFFAREKQNNGRKQSGPEQSRKRVIKYTVIGGVVVIGGVAFSDKVEHAYRAAARTGRVVGALAVCINE